MSFDEWTDSAGNVVVDILVGVGNQSYVVQTVTLECHGPNMGVEHTELVAALIDALGGLRLATGEIGFVISRVRFASHFFDEWNRYVTIDVAKAQAVDDTVQFWARQRAGLAEYATALLSTPLTSADEQTRNPGPITSIKRKN